MINITPLEFDDQGTLSLQINQERSNFGITSRRQNNVATLDGGSVLQDRGFSVSDTTYRITLQNATYDDMLRLESMQQSYPTVRFTSERGAVIGSISGLDFQRTSFRFLVVENG